MRITLDHPALAGRTGRGVRIAVIDSGIVSGHPHVGLVTEGIAISPEGEHPDFGDRLGHGTAVAAAIREKAPDAELVAVKVFDRSLVTSTEVLARAIAWAAERRVALINLSLGTVNQARMDILRAAVDGAAVRGAVIVAARQQDAVASLPGSLALVAGVDVAWELGRHEVLVGDALEGGQAVFRASGYPRPIDGVPPERNLSGVSFAVANVTGLLARALERQSVSGGLAALMQLLLA